MKMIHTRILTKFHARISNSLVTSSIFFCQPRGRGSWTASSSALGTAKMPSFIIVWSSKVNPPAATASTVTRYTALEPGLETDMNHSRTVVQNIYLLINKNNSIASVTSLNASKSHLLYKYHYHKFDQHLNSQIFQMVKRATMPV